MRVVCVFMFVCVSYPFSNLVKFYFLCVATKIHTLLTFNGKKKGEWGSKE